MSCLRGVCRAAAGKAAAVFIFSLVVLCWREVVCLLLLLGMTSFIYLRESLLFKLTIN